jgi:hypothetical protein
MLMWIYLWYYGFILYLMIFSLFNKLINSAFQNEAQRDKL